MPWGPFFEAADAHGPAIALRDIPAGPYLRHRLVINAFASRRARVHSAAAWSRAGSEEAASRCNPRALDQARRLADQGARRISVLAVIIHEILHAYDGFGTTELLWASALGAGDRQYAKTRTAPRAHAGLIDNVADLVALGRADSLHTTSVAPRERHRGGRADRRDRARQPIALT